MAVRVGIRELRHHLATYLARVAAGETLEVTDRGRPVARLVPPTTGDEALDELIAAGRVRPARVRSAMLPAAASPVGGQPTISDALREQREERLP
jgi:prevent-host-death family protein